MVKTSAQPYKHMVQALCIQA